jgi:hypothetical protein
MSILMYFSETFSQEDEAIPNPHTGEYRYSNS